MGSNETVIGHFSDDYVGLAKSRGANYFHIDDATWATLSPAQQEAVNIHLLDIAIGHGDRIVSATARGSVRVGSALEVELQYLYAHGYQWADDLSLVRG